MKLLDLLRKEKEKKIIAFTVWKLRKFTLTLSLVQKFRESNSFTQEVTT